MVGKEALLMPMQDICKTKIHNIKMSAIIYFHPSYFAWLPKSIPFQIR